ncbi:MAG: DUF748 domain-containing protein [Bacteroidota bacterium]|nr:DUF748 domain-containing protein [Bacteroidota bacterium]
MKQNWAILLGIVLLFVILRLLLPNFVTHYVNKTLAEIEGYNGSISGVDIALIRGAYKINDLRIEKEGSKLKVPFLEIDEVDLSIEWASLFKGEVIGEILILKPSMNFVAGPSKEEKMDGSEADWTKPIEELMPLSINKFEIREGNINFYNFSTNPQAHVYLQQLDMVAINLSNVEDKNEKLPSTLSLSANSIGEGILKLDGKLNLLKEIPDFDMNLKFTGAKLTQLNNFIKAYGKFEVEKGQLHLVSEAKLMDGSFEGYVKPLLQDMVILDLDEAIGKEKIPKILWEGLLEIAKTIFENPKQEQVATIVPLKGTINDVDTKVWPAIYNVLKNAFIKAFSTEFESQIENT